MRTIKVSKKELTKMYEDMSAKEACLELGVCLATFYKMIDAAGIKRKRKNISRGQNIKFEIV